MTKGYDFILDCMMDFSRITKMGWTPKGSHSSQESKHSSLTTERTSKIYDALKEFQCTPLDTERTPKDNHDSKASKCSPLTTEMTPKGNDDLKESQCSPLTIELFNRALIKLDNMENEFENVRTFIKTPNQFEEYLIESVELEFNSGFSKGNVLNFLVWSLVMSYFFYKDGKRNFPQLTMDFIAYTLDYCIEKKQLRTDEEWLGLLNDSKTESTEHVVKDMVFYNKNLENNFRDCSPPFKTTLKFKHFIDINESFQMGTELYERNKATS